ncbi:hypothetical protein D8674_017779 [Pyrus ussuriensis x Pyrus communis]|uniref:RNase H type-1 domain-containing protein n=1 Tax=Pyrus ussuriensis x Pyrus communis TaxID=2448454 RepID=A0A5N5HDP5_9ROSA|nr:hypothetical protein D8674_017779 [Pyrus ussuriensis x Pyrus communis]
MANGGSAKFHGYLLWVQLDKDVLLGHGVNILHHRPRVTKWDIELGQPEIIYQPRTSIKNPHIWKLYVDKSLNIKGAGVGIVLVMLDGSTLKQTLKLGFKASNNEAKYKVFLAGLRVAKELQVKELSIHYDSMLIVNQVTGDYTAHHPIMAF